jgi:hypothetical protein
VHTIWIDRDIVLDHIFYCAFSAKRDDGGVYHPVMKSGEGELFLNAKAHRQWGE